MSHTVPAWIERTPHIAVDADGVAFRFPTGAAYRMSHRAFRQACVDGLRQLNEWEDRTERVVALKAVG